jgi:hypothetical protein
MEDEEKVIAGRPGANIPALLTKDVPGGEDMGVEAGAVSFFAQRAGW